MQMSSSYGFLFIFIIMFLVGLHGVINSKRVKKENVDVPVSPRRDSPGCRYRAGDWWKSHSSQYLDFSCTCFQRTRNYFAFSVRPAPDISFQFAGFADLLSVRHGLNARNQKARKFGPGASASNHQTQL